MKKKYVIYTTLAVLLVGIFYFFLLRPLQYKGQIPPSTADNPQKVIQQTASAENAYIKAIQAYEGRRIQFDQNCRVSPPLMVLKNPADVMFDNNSDTNKNFFLDGQPFSLASSSYRVLHLKVANVPSTVVVDCGTDKNVGKINFE